MPCWPVKPIRSSWLISPKRRMRAKIPQLTEAHYGRFSSHHALVTRMHLDLIDQHTAAIEQLPERIEVVMEPFRSFRNLICHHPRYRWVHRRRRRRRNRSRHDRFPTAQHLASWASTTPGNNESAGKVKFGAPERAAPPARRLGTAAMSISHTRET